MELWLADSVKIMKDLGCKRDIWEEFLVWATYRSGWDTNRPYTAKCRDRNTERQYQCLYQIIKKAIQNNSHRNVLLELMAAIGLAAPDTYYDEKSAKNLLIAKIHQKTDIKRFASDTGLAGPAAWDCAESSEFDRYLAIWAVDNLVIHDSQCNDSGGSGLIALANVIRSLYASGFQDRALLIASDPVKTASPSAMMAFIQMSVMGAASYVLMDDTYGVYNRRKMAFFAPPNAICSKQFFSETWDNARMASMVWGLTYGQE